MKKIETEGENGKLLPDDDFEYEKKLAEEERERQAEAQAKAEERQKERIRREREAKAARDRKIAQDKLDLIKMKAGVASEEEEIKEEHEEKRVLSGKEKLANFWYHDKMWICFGIFLVAVVAFLVVDIVTREKPDITVMVIADDGIGQHSDELKKLFEKYTPDVNGDGEVHVSIMNIPLNDYSNDPTYSTNSTKFYANLQEGDVIMVITDSNTDHGLQALMKDDLTKDLPDNKYIDSDGLSLNFGFLAKELNFDDMPNDLHLCLRRPVATLGDSLEKMQESYDIYYEIFEKMANDLAEQAEDLDDKGLTTEPIDLKTKYPAAFTEAESKSESEGSDEKSGAE